MSAVEVEYDDIQVGDRIRITREITVSKVFENKDFLRDGEGTDGRTFFARGAKLERLPKPLDLPSVPGAVLEINGPGPRTSRWMLNTAGFWLSNFGAVRNPGELERHLRQYGFSMEVIA